MRKTRARRNERQAVRLAEQLMPQRDRILSYLGGLSNPDASSDLAPVDPWASRYLEELAALEYTAMRLHDDPAEVTQAEIEQAVTFGHHLERILLHSRLEPYRGSWVAVRGSTVVESAADPTELDEKVRDSGQSIDLFFFVSRDPELAGA